MGASPFYFVFSLCCLCSCVGGVCGVVRQRVNGSTLSKKKTPTKQAQKRTTKKAKETPKKRVSQNQKAATNGKQKKQKASHHRHGKESPEGKLGDFFNEEKS